MPPFVSRSNPFHPSLYSVRTSGAALHIEEAPDTHNTESLIAIQILDGVANAIFGVVSSQRS